MDYTNRFKHLDFASISADDTAAFEMISCARVLWTREFVLERATNEGDIPKKLLRK